MNSDFSSFGLTAVFDEIKQVRGGPFFVKWLSVLIGITMAMTCLWVIGNYAAAPAIKLVGYVAQHRQLPTIDPTNWLAANHVHRPKVAFPTC